MSSVNTLKLEKLAFYDWVFKWATNNSCSSNEIVNVDIPQIAAVLQTFGFKLESIDQPAKDDQTETDPIEMKMELKCNKSGIRAILSKRMDTCICPSSEKANEGIFWVFSGSGPSTSQESLNKIDESYSNLIPAISKEKSTMIKDIITKLFTMISETDVNQNKPVQLTPALRHSLKARSHSDLNKPSVIRSDTWEVDPKTSPPTGTSSPLPEQSKPISQVINNDKEQLLAEILLAVKENLQKALVLLPQNDNTFTKINVKRVSNIKVSPTITTPTRSTTGKSTPDLPKRSTPKKKLQNDQTPKSALGGKRLNVASKIGSFRKHTDSLVPSTTLRTKLMKTESMSNINKKPVSTCLEQKKTIGTISRSSNLSTSSSGIKYLKQKSSIPAPNYLSTIGKANAIATTKKLK